MNRNIILGLFALLIAFSSCDKVTGEGPLVEETRAETNFKSIDLSMPASLEVTKGTAFSIRISAQQNILNILKTRVSNGKLIIKFEDNINIRRYKDVTIWITVPELEGLAINGSGKIETVGSFQGTELQLSISGSGNIKVTNTVYNRITANISGSGEIGFTGGTANESEYKISGSGSIKADNVEVKTVKTVTNGSGSIWAWSTVQLNAEINGSGSVYYKGNPQLNVNISGSGKVTKMN